MDFQERIRKNNAEHVVDSEELKCLLVKASSVYSEHFDNAVWFERSVFINWSCGIADCKYCYLSTKPKNDKTALRSRESIVAEILICRAMGWKIGYITGGLRVEPTSYLLDLMKTVNVVLPEKIMMNFGPYSEKEILAFKPEISGMGAAIESFDEELHNYICPSKPLASLKKTLAIVQREGLKKFITIILGMGEKKEDVFEVIEYIKEYSMEKIQLCFLKPQENTIFDEVPPPDPEYMAWWISQIRIAHPTVEIKVALVRERISDITLYLQAGINSFSRFMVFKDFNSSYAHELVEGCAKAGRELHGSFVDVPEVDVKALVSSTPYDEEFKAKILPKAEQYYQKLRRLGKQ